MSFSRTCRGQRGCFRNDSQSSFNRHNNNNHRSTNDNSHEFSRNFREYTYNVRSDECVASSMKRRKFSASSWEDDGRHYQMFNTTGNTPSTSNSSFSAPTRPDGNAHATGYKRERAKSEEEVEFMSRDEIERLSPSRKDGIDSLRETYLRYSYCAFLQNLGMRLEVPQTTIGTAMVLCHRFFVRRSHACHDRFLIATAALFLAAKSEETLRPLNDVLRASCEICHKQDLNFFPNLLPVDWFEQYRERVIEAEQMILTTLDFELNVQHPYVPLTSVLNKLGLSQTVLINLALSLVSEGRCQHALREVHVLTVHCHPVTFIIELHMDGPLEWERPGSRIELGILLLFWHSASISAEESWKKFPPGACLHSWLRSSLWLQFKPHHIAAGAAYLAAKFLNFDLASYQRMWQEFETTPLILQDVVQQLMELFIA